MIHRAAVADVVLGILAEVCPDRLPDAGLSDETRLDNDGLGLDSIEVVEVLLGCEDYSGVPVGDLLDDEPLTFGRIVSHFSAA